MEPIKRIASTALMEAFKNKAQRRDNQVLQSHNLDAADMLCPVVQPRLKLSISSQQRYLNMSALTLFLQKMISLPLTKNEQNLALDSQFAFQYLEPQYLQSDQDVLNAQIQCCESLRVHLLEQVTCQDLRNKINEKLGSNHDFVQYSFLMADAFAGAEIIVRAIVNKTREIARELLQGPGEFLKEALNSFPPTPAELLCFDGTLTRLEQCLEAVHRQQIQLGVRQPVHLLQALDKTMVNQYSFYTTLLEEAARQYKLDQYVPKGMEVHLVAGLQIKMGVNAKAVAQKDRFAQSVLKDIPGPVFFNQLLGFEQNAIELLEKATQAPAVVQGLEQFEQTLNAAIGLDPTTEHHKLAALLAEINKNPVSQILQEQFDKNLNFEQLFAQWNDDINVIQNWDWNGLNQAIAQILDSEWFLVKDGEKQGFSKVMLGPEPFDVFSLSNRKLVATAMISTTSSIDQYFSLQTLLAKLDVVASPKSHIKQKRQAMVMVFTQIIDLVHHSSTSLKLKLPELSRRITLKILQEKQYPDINKQLFRQAHNKLIVNMKSEYPYKDFSVNEIKKVFDKKIQNEPLKISEILLLFAHSCSLVNVKTELEKSLQHFPDQSNSELVSFLCAFLNNEVAQKNGDGALFYKALVAHDPVLHKQVFLMLAQDRLYPISSQEGIEFFAKKFDREFIDIFSINELYHRNLSLAREVIVHSFASGDLAIASKVFESSLARDILIENNDDASNSIPYFAEHYFVHKTDELLSKKIDALAWPEKNFLDSLAQVKDSRLIKHIVNTCLFDRFSYVANVLVNQNEQHAFAIFDFYLLPFFQNIRTHEDVVFFNHACQSLDAVLSQKVNNSAEKLVVQNLTALFDVALKSKPIQQQLLFCVLLQSLPREYVQSISGLLGAQQVLEFPAVNRILQAKGVDTLSLQAKYPRVQNKTDQAAQILCASTLPFRQKSKHFDQRIIELELYNIQFSFSDATNILAIFATQSFVQQCQRLECTSGQIMAGILNRFETSAINSMLCKFENLIDEDIPLLKSLDAKVVQLLFAFCKSHKSLSNQKIAENMNQVWQLSKTGGRWVAQLKT